MLLQCSVQISRDTCKQMRRSQILVSTHLGCGINCISYVFVRKVEFWPKMFKSIFGKICFRRISNLPSWVVLDVGQVRLGQVRLGQVRSGQFGQVRLDQVRLGQVRNINCHDIFFFFENSQAQSKQLKNSKKQAIKQNI